VTLVITKRLLQAISCDDPRVVGGIGLVRCGGLLDIGLGTTGLPFVGVTDSSANTGTGKYQAFGAACSKRLQ